MRLLNIGFGLLLAAGLLGLAALPARCGDDEEELSVSEADRREVAAWVALLGDARFEIREEAGRKLAAYGVRILPLLEEALVRSGDDPEISVRLQDLLKTAREAAVTAGFARRIVVRRSGQYRWRRRWSSSAAVSFYFVRIPGRDQPGKPYLRYCAATHGNPGWEDRLDLGRLEKGEEIVLLTRTYWYSTAALSSSAENPRDFQIIELRGKDTWRVVLDEGLHMGEPDALIYLERTGPGGEALPGDPAVDFSLPHNEFQAAVLKFAGHDRLPLHRKDGNEEMTDDPDVVGPGFKPPPFDPARERDDGIEDRRERDE